MEGYHGTVFAYGMTGSGKTHSMQGTDSEPGIIPNAVTDIFAFIRLTPSREFLLRVSYLEIFNERIYDLLTQTGIQSDTQQETIKLREDSKRGVYASPLKEEIVQTPAQLLRIISQGHQVRRTSSTQYNARSSRSHAVIQIVIESRERRSSSDSCANNRLGLVTSSGFRVSTLNLIDLAGSERASDCKERRAEGGHINKSLLTLGTIISRLTGNKGKDANQHLPYRDSKLTRLLQSALSGNSLISILCTVQLSSGGTVAANYTQETLSTLKFAARARNNIVSHAKRIEVELDSRALLTEIIELRKLVAEQQLSSRRSKSKEMAREREMVAEERHSEQMLEMQIARLALKERIDQLNRLTTTLTTHDAKSLMTHSTHPLASTIEACIQSLSSSSTLTLATQAGSRGSTNSAPASSNGGYFTAHASTPSTEVHSARTTSLTSLDLRTQLADKDRYIASLERELVETAKLGSGPSSSSMVFAGDIHPLLLEKDVEIKDLRERLLDKDRMLAALRGAIARKHELENAAGRAASRTPPGLAVSKFSATTTNSKKSATSTQVKSQLVAAPPSPTFPTPNPKKVDEMTRLLREMASSISVPSLQPLGSSVSGSSEAATTPNGLRIVLPKPTPGATRSAGPKSPGPRFLSPVSPSNRQLSGWESGVARKRASLARSETSDVAARGEPSKGVVDCKDGVGLGLATPPSSPPREVEVVAQG